ncbi:sensor histidine kinase [Enterococcus plantarum]|uniref:sensor histidine kinase n=1 Tax=Enterococcus plantarum TaxID=1077675 RepID=UPI001F5F1E94|nr:sensor histidine kinase [Enterococcus plantarum]
MKKEKIANFKATTRTVNLLGRDNVLDYRSAVLELVKNSYDAFSKRVDVTINNENVEIIDYGSGMSYEKILEVFFTVGTDDKTNMPYIETDGDKRIMNGSMGIGRLSLGRLGKKSTIITSDSYQAHKFDIDWTVFSSGKDIGSIKIPITEISLGQFEEEYKHRNLHNPSRKGTIIISKDLSDDWERSKNNKEKDNYILLKQSLGKLKNPMKNQDFEDFQIFLNYFGEVESIEYEIDELDSDAYITFSYSYDDDLLVLEGEFPEINVLNLPPDFINKYYNELRKYITKDGKRINKFSFYDEKKISEFLLETPPKNPIGDFDGTIYFTKKSGGRQYPFINPPASKYYEFDYEPGISLYRDGFRIRPYGETDTIGFDWLGIENIRAKDPAAVSRPTYLMQANQLSGFINITKEKNNGFEDQSNREGLKKSSEFSYLVKILIQIIKEFSQIRSNLHILYNEYLDDISDKTYHSRQGKSKKRTIDRLLKKNFGDSQKLFEDKEFQKIVTPKTILELYSLTDVSQDENDSLISELDMLRTLATQGIIMSTFAHQIKNDKIFFRNVPINLKEIGDLYEQRFGVRYDELEEDENIYCYADSIERKNSSILGFIENATKNPKKARKTKINLIEYLNFTLKWWENSIRDNYNTYNYTVNGEQDYTKLADPLKKIFVHASDHQLDCIFLNLISNSHKSFEEGKIVNRNINIDVSLISSNHVKFVYSDNGIGLSEEIEDKNNIFEPYKTYSERYGGTGMGMWIFYSIVRSLKGEKKLLSEKGEKGFEIEFTLLGGAFDE